MASAKELALVARRLGKACVTGLAKQTASLRRPVASTTSRSPAGCRRHLSGRRQLYAENAHDGGTSPPATPSSTSCCVRRVRSAPPPHRGKDDGEEARLWRAGGRLLAGWNGREPETTTMERTLDLAGCFYWGRWSLWAGRRSCRGRRRAAAMNPEGSPRGANTKGALPFSDTTSRKERRVGEAVVGGGTIVPPQLLPPAVGTLTRIERGNQRGKRTTGRGGAVSGEGDGQRSWRHQLFFVRTRWPPGSQ